MLDSMGEFQELSRKILLGGSWSVPLVLRCSTLTLAPVVVLSLGLSGGLPGTSIPSRVLVGGRGSSLGRAAAWFFGWGFDGLFRLTDSCVTIFC